MSTLSSFVKKTIQSAGYDLRRIPATTGASISPLDPYSAQATLMSGLGIDKPLVFDVGANRGHAADDYLEQMPSAKVHCFEPFPTCVEVLRDKFGGNQSVTIVPSAVADKKDTREFHVNGSDATNSLLPRPSEGRRYFSSKATTLETIELPVTTLDDYVREGNLPAPDILKLDIQGGERLALAGAHKLLESGKIPVIFSEVLFVELYKDCALFHELCAILAPYGYSLVNLYETQVATNGQIRFGDALFVNQSTRERVIDAFPQEP